MKQARFKQLKQHDHHFLMNPKVTSDTFRSQAFLIRYCEEEAELHDIVIFRCEIPMTEGCSY